MNKFELFDWLLIMEEQTQNELTNCLQNFYEKYFYDNTQQTKVFTESCEGKNGGNCISLSIALLDKVKEKFFGVFLFN